MVEETNSSPTFDFDSHRQKAVDAYVKVRPTYEAFSGILKNILEECLASKQIQCHSIEARAKTLQSFADKASKPCSDNPDKPKYENPLVDIKDLAGVRVITFFPKTIDKVDAVVVDEFDIIEKSDKSDILDQEEKLGYQSVHYLVKLKDSRSNLSEYKRYKDLVAEVQVRTILQHAWAEIEHDIQYKSVVTIPNSIKRRFMALAGLLEIADREFQSIQDEDKQLRIKARKSVIEGKLQDVEITPDALKAYLDKRLGSDGRMTDFSYSFATKVLLNIGFSNLKQIDDCTINYDDDKISRILWGKRQGQMTRFEEMLLASLGETYKLKHPWGKAKYDWWFAGCDRKLKKLSEAGIETGKCSAYIKE